MKLSFFGTGDAFSYHLGHNSALIEFENDNLAIDFPASNRKYLIEMGKELDYIKSVYISHLHEDHINGIQQLIHYKNIVSKEKLNIYIAVDLVEEFWNTVKSGLQYSHYGNKELSDLCNIIKLEEGKVYQIEGCNFSIKKTDHMPEMKSYGILFEGKFYFSGDANVDDEYLAKICEDVQYIFHDCHLWDLEIKSHASLEEIKALPDKCKQKMILMHYHDGYKEESKRKEMEQSQNVRIARPLEVFQF